MKKSQVDRLVSGTYQHVIAHAQWRRSRGRNFPSLPYKHEKNPIRALQLALKDASEAARGITELGERMSRIRFISGMPGFVGSGAADELQKMVRTAEGQEKFTFIYAWDGNRPYNFEGFRVVACVTTWPGTPEEHRTFSLAETGKGSYATLRDRVVWPPRFADKSKNIYPLVAMQRPR